VRIAKIKARRGFSASGFFIERRLDRAPVGGRPQTDRWAADDEPKRAMLMRYFYA